MITCRVCGENKPAELFEKEKRNTAGVTGRCLACRCEHRRKSGEYFAERLRKFSKRKGDSRVLMSVEDIERLLRQRECSYCGCHMNGNATADHVYAIGKYGQSNIAENIVASCRSCNSAKGSKHVYDFYQSSPKFTDELFHKFVADYTERLIGRKLTDEEVEQMKQNFADEARDLEGGAT
jgi:5-methylcytosine-specific restriction endonuclease McrA